MFKLIVSAPQWLTLLVALTLGFVIPFIIADRKTGLFYNFSYSGVVGDAALLVIIFIGVEVVKRGTPLPYWFSGNWPQLIWLVVCIAIGAYLSTAATPWPIAAWPDRYHNAVTVPLFLFVLPLMILAICYNGDQTEIVISFLLLAIWTSLVFYDFADNRINQPQKLERDFAIKLTGGRYVSKLRHP